MNIQEAVLARHSVRAYKDDSIAGETLEKLRAFIDECDKEGDLHFQLVLNEEKAFKGGMVRYGFFKNVKNYIVLAGKKADDLEERCGYFGEKLVLYAQTIGLSTCWVGMKTKDVKENYELMAGEKRVLTIAIGYGADAGSQHRSKGAGGVSNASPDSPEWFIKGVECALLAPTAINQQKFKFELVGEKVKASTGMGPFVRVDLGIVKYHFELGSGKGHDIWL